MIIILIIIILLIIGCSVYLFYKINKYINSLELKIQDNTIVIENLKQSFRDVLINENFLLDDGKITKTLLERKVPQVYNGNMLTEQGVDF